MDTNVFNAARQYIENAERQNGKIVTINRFAIGTKHESMYGLIEGDDGAFYVWNLREFFRNGSRPSVDARCSFVAFDRYAINVSTVD